MEKFSQAELAFIRNIAIENDPKNTLPLLLYADWLDEQGGKIQSARSELIRIQLAMESAASGTPDYAALDMRCKELCSICLEPLKEEMPGFLWRKPIKLDEVKFKRGFPVFDWKTLLYVCTPEQFAAALECNPLLLYPEHKQRTLHFSGSLLVSLCGGIKDTEKPTKKQQKSSNDKLEKIRIMLEAGADLNQMNNMKYTPIYRAIKSHNDAVFDVLMDNNPKPDISVRSRMNGLHEIGESILSYAVANGTMHMVERLIEQGAESNPAASRSSQSKPIEMAMMTNNLPAFELLIKMDGAHHPSV